MLLLFNFFFIKAGNDIQSVVVLVITYTNTHQKCYSEDEDTIYVILHMYIRI